MPKISALPNDTTPTLDDYTYNLETTSTTAEKTQWSNVLKMLLAGIYPVGCIYTEITGVNPSTTFGFGTWTAFGAGRTTIGVDTGDSDFATVQQTGGGKTHFHWQTVGSDGGGMYMNANGDHGDGPPHSRVVYRNRVVLGVTSVADNTREDATYDAGNVPPYITVYMWKRTA